MRKKYDYIILLKPKSNTLKLYSDPRNLFKDHTEKQILERVFFTTIKCRFKKS